jgi:hypothetical protein
MAAEVIGFDLAVRDALLTVLGDPAAGTESDRLTTC